MAEDEWDEDRGHGHVTHFPAEDLERLYKSTSDGDVRIRGDALNQLFKVKSYAPLAWYVVTGTEVKKL